MSGGPAQAELEALAAAVGEALLQRGERLATAESCTGGWIGQCCTAIAGSSNWFDRGHRCSGCEWTNGKYRSNRIKWYTRSNWFYRIDRNARCIRTNRFHRINWNAGCIRSYR